MLAPDHATYDSTSDDDECDGETVLELSKSREDGSGSGTINNYAPKD